MVKVRQKTIHTLFEDGPLVYPANTIDPRLRGDYAPLVQAWQPFKLKSIYSLNSQKFP